MKTPSLFGSLMAALLLASPSVAFAQYNGGGGNGNGGVGSGTGYYRDGYSGNGGAFRSHNGNHGTFAGNGGRAGDNGSGNGTGVHGQMAYSTIGEGGLTGRAVLIHNGNNGGGNGNVAYMRPSQRNHLLADNGDARASKMIGTGVFNERNHHLGSVSDVLIGRNGVWAIVSTNNKKVAVPFRDFAFGDSNVNSNNALVLPRVTQRDLNAQPAFHYHLTNYQNGNRNNRGGWFSRNNTGNGYAGNHNNGDGWLGAHDGGINGNGNNG